MGSIITEEYSEHGRLDKPYLFTHTHNFKFHCSSGKLVHRKLPSGPKGYTVVAVSSTGHDASFQELDRVAVTLPLTGHAEVRAVGRTFVTKPGDLFAIGPCERSSSLVPPGEAGRYTSYTIISPQRNAGIRSGDCWLFRPGLRKAPRLKRLIDFSFRMFQGARPVTESQMHLVEALVEDVFLDALSQSGDDRDAKSDARWYEWVVRAAQTYMEAHFNAPVSVPDIAGSVGVGTRTLQLAFQNRRGVTPKQFLTEVRLRGMRRQLASPEPNTTVTSAALDSGLLHLGRCIGLYRRLFGESPADTLRRAGHHRARHIAQTI